MGAAAALNTSGSVVGHSPGEYRLPLSTKRIAPGAVTLISLVLVPGSRRPNSFLRLCIRTIVRPLVAGEQRLFEGDRREVGPCELQAIEGVVAQHQLGDVCCQRCPLETTRTVSPLQLFSPIYI